MKSNIYRIISGLLFPIVFIVLFFVIGGTDHGTTCWIGFGVTLLVYIIMIAVPLLIPNSQSKYLFGLTNSTVIGIFFVIQFITGLIFMIADFDEWKIALIIEIIIVIVTIFLLIQLLRADEATAEHEKKQQQEALSVKKLVVKTQTILSKTSSKNIKRYVKNVYDELNSCPISSNSKTETIDNIIFLELDDLNKAVLSEDLNSVRNYTESIIALIKERKSSLM